MNYEERGVVGGCCTVEVQQLFLSNVKKSCVEMKMEEILTIESLEPENILFTSLDERFKTINQLSKLPLMHLMLFK